MTRLPTETDLHGSRDSRSGGQAHIGQRAEGRGEGEIVCSRSTDRSGVGTEPDTDLGFLHGNRSESHAHGRRAEAGTVVCSWSIPRARPDSGEGHHGRSYGSTHHPWTGLLLLSLSLTTLPRSNDVGVPFW